MAEFRDSNPTQSPTWIARPLCVYIYTILTLNENESFTTTGRIQHRRL